ncbi:MAG: outer membrane beta-barrel protein [Filimonas sp.]|nr:outer membrane beta-barrel protein [Filimonas sp.]
MRVKNIFFTITVLMLSATASFAQSGSLTNLFAGSWEIAFPVNKDFLTKTSLSGGRLEYRKFIKPNVSVGLAASWNSFDQYFNTATYQKSDGTGAVTTDMVRQIYTVPITATIHYYLKGGKHVLPYVGIGIGTQYSEQNAYFNVYELTANNWGFVVRPEIGVLMPFNRYWSVLLAGGYNVSTNKNDEFKIDNLKQWTLNVGLACKF